MAETLQFDLVSPERRLASVQALEVRVPGIEGDFTAMAGHAPFLTVLRPGIVEAITPEGDRRYLVTGGFAEVGPHSISVLAERAHPVLELTRAHFDTLVSEARAAHAAAPAEKASELEKFLNDLLHLEVHIAN